MLTLIKIYESLDDIEQDIKNRLEPNMRTLAAVNGDYSRSDQPLPDYKRFNSPSTPEEVERSLSANKRTLEAVRGD